MYTTSSCPRRKEAKVWMAANGVADMEKDIEASDPNMAECRRFTPKTSIPTTVIDGTSPVGFGERSYRGAIDNAAERRRRRER